MPLMTRQCFVFDHDECGGELPQPNVDALVFACGCECHGPVRAANATWREMRDEANRIERERVARNAKRARERRGY